MEDAINTNTPTVGAISRTFPDKIVSLLFVYIAALNESLNLTRGMNDQQVTMCANQILNKHKRLTMADVHVIFQKAHNGDYDLFEGLSGAKIINWFNDYFNERCNHIGTKNESEHHHTKHHVDVIKPERSSGKGNQSILEIKAIINKNK